MKPYRPMDTIKVKDDEFNPEEDLLAIESVLELKLDGKFIASFICSPGNEQALSIGYLLSMGILESFDSIEAIDCSNQRCNITSKRGAGIHLDRDISRVRRVVSTECSAPELLRILRTGSGLPVISGEIEIPKSKLAEFSEILRRNQGVRSKTGATHGALVAELASGRYVLAEDLGRHSAVDKAIGLAIQQRYNLSSCLLISSGRLTADIVSKSIWTGIPLLVSFAVATDAGVLFAQKGNLTLVGALRRNHMRVYNIGSGKINLD